MKKEPIKYTLDENFDFNIIKSMTDEELGQLSDEVKMKIIDSVSKNGGHLSSNLGITDLVVALFNFYDFEKDKIIFDVGHQSYAYKILTGRNLDNLRQENGVDGFQKISESKYDHYEAGHSSTSISAAMGMAYKRDIDKEDYRVISVIGDASFSNGLSLEALFNLSTFNHKMIIILNDNEMSITEPVGGFNKLLQKIRISSGYSSTKNKFNSFLHKTYILRPLQKLIRVLKKWLVARVYKTNIFSDMGLYYYGIIDGHNFKKLRKAFKAIDKTNKPVVLHVGTIKGKGYKYSENDKTGKWHSVPAFNKETGEFINNGKENTISYPKLFSDLLDKYMEYDKNVISITPATGYGSKLTNIKEKYPDRYFDVGIMEEHAVVFASSLALSGLKPYLTIYSTFLQRSYDELLHDTARMNAPLTILIDHTGLTGNDGETHQGIYDYNFLSSIPNMNIIFPSNYNEAVSAFEFSKTFNKPLAIRFIKGNVNEVTTLNLEYMEYLEWKEVNTSTNNDICVLTFGPHIEDIKKFDLDFTLVNALFQYPLNKEKIKELLKYKNIIIYDPYGTVNGFSSLVSKELLEMGYKNNIKIIAIDEVFVQKGTVSEQEKRLKVDTDTLYNYIKSIK